MKRCYEWFSDGGGSGSGGKFFSAESILVFCWQNEEMLQVV